MEFEFRITESVNDVQVVRSTKDIIKVGSLEKSDLKLLSPSVSRIHAVIEKRDDDTFSLIDLGSASGTYVNGKKVTKSTIVPGDELRFGDVVVEFTIKEVSSAEEKEGGFFDDEGNYFPGYYDDEGTHHLGYRYFEDQVWKVAQGYYAAAGDWIPEKTSAKTVENESISDMKVYQDAFFEDKGGDTLEIAMLWGDHLLSLNNYNHRSLTIGSHKTSDFSIGNLEMDLVHYDGLTYSLNFNRGMTGLIKDTTKSYTLAQAVEEGLAAGNNVFSIPLHEGMSARVEIDDTTFLVHFTDLPVFAAQAQKIDWQLTPYIGGSSAAHIMLLMLAMMMPDSARALSLDNFEANDRFVQLMIEPEEDEIEESAVEDTGSESAKEHEGEAGEAGKEDTPDVKQRMAIKGEAEDISLRKERDIEIAMNSGIMNQVSVAGVFGINDASEGMDTRDIIGGLEGEIGESGGTKGMHIYGAGRGGGGDDKGIGFGGDMGTCKGLNCGGGGRNGEMGKAKWGKKNLKMPARVVPGIPIADGGLDKEIIRRVVRQHRRELKNCFERELQKNRNLGGVVTVKFIISPNGRVLSSRVATTSLKNSKVESCVAGRIRRWVFPKPKGGVMVKVRYPFNFKH